MITKLLSTAVKLYLRSQVSQVKDLHVKIGGKNRQILKGYIPYVFFSCQQGIYRGLHLREVKVSGKDIAFNLSEVLKKKPLRLLEPIVVEVELNLLGEDLANSIDSALLQSGLTDLWQIISNYEGFNHLGLDLKDDAIQWNNIAITQGKLNISGIYKNSNLSLSTGILLANTHSIYLSPLKIIRQSKAVINLPEKLFIDLGNDVNIKTLVIEEEKLFCSGKITVNN